MEGAMRKSLKVSRGAQLAGCALLVMGIVSCSTRGDPQAMSWSFIAGVLLVVGGKTYEWLSKE